jgi:ubiquinone/menaquinone biosynthesis C-methylase UbiE
MAIAHKASEQIDLSCAWAAGIAFKQGLRSGQTVLDVAAGGTCSLAAARRFCEVTSTDYVAELLERGKQRAEAEGLTMTFQSADAENLPFENDSFDIVTSTFGAMFAPDQAAAASELLRVCKPGGKIGLANWTPESFIGKLFTTLGRHIPPPAGINPPAFWGTHDYLDTLFADARKIDATKRIFNWRYRSPQHWVDTWRVVYGPLRKAFESLDPDGQAALSDDLVELIGALNLADDGTMVVPSAYLEVIVTK